jgi:GNAT superfamily N-acetyltransferase
MEVRGLRLQDWPAVRAVYEAGIATGNANFETGAPSWEDWDAAHLPAHRLVAAEGGRVLGWAALAPVSDRCAYAGVAEDSVYVAPDAQGRGGRAPAAGVAGNGRRAGRHLDHADWDLPREPGQRPAAPGLWLPGRRCPGAPGPPAWPLA